MNPQDPDMSAMKSRLFEALSQEDIFRLVFDDLRVTFGFLGCSRVKADALVTDILISLRDSFRLSVTEMGLRNLLGRTMVGQHQPILEVLREKMADRASLIFLQTSRFFKLNEKIVDWGCGDGQVTNLIHRHISTAVEGYDVRDYKAPGVEARIETFNGRFVPVRNEFFDAGLMTNVAHHEANNILILKELARIIKPGGRLVVIETVPIEDDPIQFERTFVLDYVYNRIFQSAEANVPVPGTYETEAGWVKRFDEVGFDLMPTTADLQQNPLPLGYDQELIRDWHTLLVLVRRGAVKT